MNSRKKTHRAYCSACDREVLVMLRPDVVLRPDAPIPADAYICLAHGDSCTGALCPLFGLPGETMRQNLERSGLRRDA